MSELRKAAEAVLEAWDWDWSEPRNEALRERMEALRQALAQPEQKGHCTCGDPEALGVVHFRTRPCFHYTEPLAQPEQEPVAIVNEGMGGIEWLSKPLPDDTPLYTASPKREWVGLTEEEIDLYALDIGVTANKAPAWLVVYAKDIEAKLKEKNT